MFKIERDVLKQFIGLLILGISSYFIMNAANAYLLKVLGYSHYGDFSIAISLIFSLTPFFALGITSLLLKFLPVYLEKQQSTKKNIFMKWNLGMLVRTMIYLAVFLIGLTLYRTSVLDGKIPCLFRNCLQYRHFVEDLHFLVPISLLLIWNACLLNASKNTFYSQIFGTNSVVYVCAFVIFIAEVFSISINHTGILLAISISFLLLCIMQCLVIYRRLLIPNILNLNEIKSHHVSTNHHRFYIKRGVGLMLNSIIYVSISLVSMLMIEIIDPNEAVLGQYVIIMKIGSLTMIVSSAFSMIMMPYLADLRSSERQQSLQSLINTHNLYSTFWMILCLVLFFIFKPFIFDVYNIDFKYAQLAIIYVFVFNFIIAFISKSEMICLYNDLNKQIYWISIIEGFILIALCYWLIPLFSYWGALFALTASSIFPYPICQYLLKSKGIKIKIWTIF